MSTPTFTDLQRTELLDALDMARDIWSWWLTSRMATDQERQLAKMKLAVVDELRTKVRAA